MLGRKYTSIRIKRVQRNCYILFLGSLIVCLSYFFSRRAQPAASASYTRPFTGHAVVPYSRACFMWTSDYYSGACSSHDEANRGCGNNGLKLINASRVAAFDGAPGKWSIGPRLDWGMHPNYHMHHAYGSLMPALDFYRLHKGSFNTLLLPRDFYERSGHVKFVTNGFRDLHGLNLTLLEPGKVHCVDNFVLVKESKSMQQSLAELQRDCIVQGCALRQRWRPPPSEVLLYNRSPEMRGNMRFVANFLDLYLALREVGLRVRSWTMGEDTRFCEQAAQLHGFRGVVITPHGTHMVPLILVTPGTTVIELQPRKYRGAPFCAQFENLGVKQIHMSQTSEGELQPFRWCEPGSNPEKDTKGAVLLEPKHQDKLYDIVHLSRAEVARIVRLVQQAIG